MSELQYDPAPVQTEFHKCTAREALLGGAAGPGKSLCLLMDPLQTQLFFEHERWRRGEIRESVGKAIHFRRQFPMLEETIQRSQRMFPLIDSGAKYDTQKHTWIFRCGYMLQFGHIQNEADRFNYTSNQYTHIAYDELCEFTPEQYHFVNTRLRTSDPFLRPLLRIRAATNPAGNWVRDYFVDPAPKGRVLLTKIITRDDGTTEKRSRIFIPATLKDNPDPGFRAQYEIELRDKPAHIRLALLNGDWYVVAGAFFAAEFDPAVHVCEPFRIPSGWFRFRSMDWGYKSHGVVLWWAVNTDGQMFCYRELSFRGRDALDLAEDIRAIEIEADEWDMNKDCSRLSGPADTQIWEQRGTIGPTIVESMQEVGVFWEKCTKNTRASVAQFIQRLRDRSGEQRTPGIRFFNTARMCIRTIPARGTNPNDPELPEDGGDDHWLDAVRYACMYRTVIPERDTAPARKRFVRDELEERRRARRQRPGGRFGYGGF